MNKSLSSAVAQLEREIDILRVKESRHESQVASSNKTLLDLETENNYLGQEKTELTALLGKSSQIELGGITPNGIQIIVGINDLEKRNEEAVFDALTAFDKKCPYCSKEQFRVGIRDKIEIDHFIPISKGGAEFTLESGPNV